MTEVFAFADDSDALTGRRVCVLGSIEPFHEGTSLTSSVLLIFARSDISEETLNDYLSENFESTEALPRFSKMEASRYQSRRNQSPQIKTTGSARRKQKSGCLLQLFLIATLVVCLVVPFIF